MLNQKHKLGQQGEELAAQFLSLKGYRILARNLKNRYGEIDILALDGPTTVLVEVKTKSNSVFGMAAEMITPAKKRKLQLLARVLVAESQLVEYRIDVVAIDYCGSSPIIEHFVDIN